MGVGKATEEMGCHKLGVTEIGWWHVGSITLCSLLLCILDISYNEKLKNKSSRKKIMLESPDLSNYTVPMEFRTHFLRR